MANVPTDSGNEGGTLDVEFVPEQALADDIGVESEETRRTPRQALRDEAGKLGGQAGDRLKAFADDGKTRASTALGEFAKMIDGAAGDVDAKLGEQFGGYARSASGAVQNLADTIGNKDIDDLVDDVGAFVRKSPGVAIGVAAALGFVVARVLQSGLEAGRDVR